MPIIWNTKEWKKKRAEWVAGRSCAWCGSTDRLVPHHPFVIPTMKELVKKEKYKARIRRRASERKIKIGEREMRIWVVGRGIDIIDISELSANSFETLLEVAREKQKQAIDGYMTLEGCIPLCKRCHFAEHRGMKLCSVCKKKYHKLNYQTCWGCRDTIPRTSLTLETTLPCGEKVAEGDGFSEVYWGCHNHCPKGMGEVLDCNVLMEVLKKERKDDEREMFTPAPRPGPGTVP